MAKYVGQLGEFGDARRASVGDRLIERVVETGSLVIHTLGGDRAGEIAIHRFSRHPQFVAKKWWRHYQATRLQRVRSGAF